MRVGGDDRKARGVRREDRLAAAAAHMEAEAREGEGGIDSRMGGEKSRKNAERICLINAPESIGGGGCVCV